MVDYQHRDTRRGGGSTHDRNDHDADEHAHHHEHDLEELGVAIVTISSTRSLDEDPGGDQLATSFEAAGHSVVTRELIGDDHDRIQSVVDGLVGRDDVDIVVTTGGTGVTPDDVTIEAVEVLFAKTLPGVGELFRRLSYDEIGPRAVASRATGGIAKGVPVFCLPGSEAAVRLGAEEVLLPVASHLAGLAGRDAS